MTLGYEHDIYLSYAHVDDVAFIGLESGWVSNFVREIKESLTPRLNRALRIAARWRPAGSEYDPEGLANPLEQCRRSSSLLVVLSPGYLESESCQEELKAFLGSRSRETRNVFVVEKEHVDRAAVPSGLIEGSSYRFWTAVDGRTHTLGLVTSKEQDADCCFSNYPTADFPHYYRLTSPEFPRFTS